MSTAPPTTPPTAGAPQRWRRPPHIANPRTRWALYICASVYLLWALSSVEVDVARLFEGMSRARTFFAAALTPDFVTRWSDIRAGILESLTMTVVATVAGIALSVPLGLGAARNLAIRPVYLVCRAILAGTRAFHEIILAIMLVAMFGFGPFAGVVTLVVSTIGFLGKLIAEDIEAIQWNAVEAVESAGASWLQRVVYAVLPQIMPRFIGLSLYRLDINFRESAVIGIVGAGGIGATLTTAFDRYEFEAVSAILILIITTVFIAEYIAGAIRRKVL
ncbi:phosphonate ABC transporter, permease protein PhnE [Lujinxingia vulgaris]|uniref:Phosphonate ABC transporter, permease protein PhnE n=1 Tax=Lujinxingia vulgaris TaxID=2600176 RepID=A0A5C6XI56_9DELT|nr:phosphonate ABC transporter, permease protein PhnE [Lujinxingia vulgaris]TXD36952.1 phosphonate ABC transporter, permease protein PhnE [Lujinxingia vulgaris]